MARKDSQTFFKIYTTMRTYAEGVLLTVLFALILRNFVITPFRVPNAIMAPGIVAGDFVMAYRLPYGLRLPFFQKKLGQNTPQRGELVVFPCPESRGKTCLRRVVALEGDRVEVRGERLVVNGEEAEYEPVASQQEGFRLKEAIQGRSYEILIHGDGQRSRFGPYIVGPESVFVLSDHRGLGEDSRDWGGVKTRQIEARVSFIWLSLDWPTESNRPHSNGPVVRWERLFHSPD